MANNMGIMPGTTICGLADGAAWPIKNAIAKFRAELEDYIRSHQTADARITPLQESIAHGQRPAIGAKRSLSALPVLVGRRQRRATLD